MVDRVVAEPLGGAHKNHEEMALTLKSVLKEELSQLLKIKPEKLLENRIENLVQWANSMNNSGI